MKNLTDAIQTASIEYDKFKSGNKSAGARLRKALMIIRTECVNIKKESLAK